MSTVSREDFENFLIQLKEKKENIDNFLQYYPFIKESLLEAVEIVKEIKQIDRKDPEFKVHQHTIDIISNTLVDIYNIDKNTFSTMLDYSGFTQDQIDVLAKEINSNTNTQAMTSLLLDSFSENINILNNPNSKSIFSNNQYEVQTHNIYSEFLDYIISSVLPMQKMENLAKLSLFQKVKMEDLIALDDRFESIFQKFKRKEKISTNDQNYLRKTVEENVYKMMQKVPVYTNKDGVFYAAIEEQKENFDVWKGISGRNRPDAYGIDRHGVLHVATVTSNPHYNNQNNQAIEWAHYLNNGIAANQITEANDFKVVSCCAPLLDKHNNLKNIIEDLNKKGIINFNDIHALKRFPVDSEVLSLFKDVSLDKYADLKDKIEFNILGEKFNIKLKDMQDQYKESMTNLHTTLNIIEEIIQQRPDFDLIKTGIKHLVEAVAKGLHSGLNSPLRESADIEELAQSIKQKARNIKESLINSDQSVRKVLIIAAEDSEDIQHTKDMLNKRYQEEKITITQWLTNIKPTNKIRASKYSEDYDLEPFYETNSSRSKLSLVLSLNYNNGWVTNRLINSALIYQAEKIYKKTEGYFYSPHQSSWDALINSLSKIYTNKKDYDLTRSIRIFRDLGMLKDINKSLQSKKNKLIDERIETFHNKIFFENQDKNSFKP